MAINITQFVVGVGWISYAAKATKKIKLINLINRIKIGVEHHVELEFLTV